MQHVVWHGKMWSTCADNGHSGCNVSTAAHHCWHHNKTRTHKNATIVHNIYWFYLLQCSLAVASEIRWWNNELETAIKHVQFTLLFRLASLTPAIHWNSYTLLFFSITINFVLASFSVAISLPRCVRASVVCNKLQPLLTINKIIKVCIVPCATPPTLTRIASET